MVMSTMLASLAEGMSLTDALGLDMDALIEVNSTGRIGLESIHFGFVGLMLLPVLFPPREFVRTCS